MTMDYDVAEQIAWLAWFLPGGLFLFIAIHFFVLPTATKLWDFFTSF